MTLTSAFQAYNSNQNESSALTRADFTVNYLWINETIFDPDWTSKTEPLCAIPLHLVDQAIKTAKQYPDTDIRIWTDPELYKNSPTQFILESFLYAHEWPSNITLCNIRDIESYSEDSFFDINSKTSIWARVDLARLLLLQHCLIADQSTHKAHIYADFDTQDVFHNFDKIEYAISNFGIALGCVKSPNPVFDYGDKAIENSYLAISNQQIMDRIVRETYEGLTLAPQILKDDRDTGYILYLCAVETSFDKFNVCRNSVLLADMSKASGYVLPQPDYLKGISF